MPWLARRLLRMLCIKRYIAHAHAVLSGSGGCCQRSWCLSGSARPQFSPHLILPPCLHRNQTTLLISLCNSTTRCRLAPIPSALDAIRVARSGRETCIEYGTVQLQCELLVWRNLISILKPGKQWARTVIHGVLLFSKEKHRNWS